MAIINPISNLGNQLLEIGHKKAYAQLEEHYQECIDLFDETQGRMKRMSVFKQTIRSQAKIELEKAYKRLRIEKEALTNDIRHSYISGSKIQNKIEGFRNRCLKVNNRVHETLMS